MTTRTLHPPAPPALSVVIPTYGRGEAALRLLDNLARQSLPEDRFVVIVVDDGSVPAVPLDPARYPYRCTAVWQPNRGPAAARNRAITLARAPLTLILNDDAVPAPNLLEKHLEAHRGIDPRLAVLGTFQFTEKALDGAFVRVLANSDLLFNFPRLQHGAVLDWTFFWTCNISLATDRLRSVDGFDARTFDRAICEDVELGMRLEREGGGVLYREDCVAHHDHRLAPREYLSRAFLLGRFQYRTGVLHDMLRAFFAPQLFADHDRGAGARIHPRVLDHVRAHYPETVRFFDELEALDAERPGGDLSAGEIETLARRIREAAVVPWLAGVAYEATGIDAREPAPLAGAV